MNNNYLRWMVLLMICIMTIPTAMAQEKDKKKEPKVYLWGRVFDQFTGKKLQADVVLMTSDSTAIDTTQSSSDYADFNFEVPAKKTTFILKFSIKGYHTKYVNYTIKYVGRNQYFEIPNVKMKRKMEDFTHDLGEVEVKATRIKMCYHGDTIVYDARAFSVPEGSMLDGLIRQMPGAELSSDGTITINGKKVDFLTLNGEDFFKGDNKAMLENLPYYTVKDIKVYNKMSEKDRKTGKMTEKPSYVMDINLKPEYHGGYFGNVMAAGGTEKRFDLRAFLAQYDDFHQYGFYAQSNNLNQSPRPGEKGNWNPNSIPEGRHLNESVGADMQNYNKDKTLRNNFSANFKYSRDNNVEEGFNRTYNQGGDLENHSSSDVLSHQKEFSMENQFNYHIPNWYVWSFARLNYSKYDNVATSLGETSRNGSMIDTGRNSSAYNRDNFYFNLSNQIQHKLPWGDEIAFGFYGYYSKNTNDSEDQDSTYQYEKKNLLMTHTQENGESSNWNVSPSLGYRLNLKDFCVSANVDGGIGSNKDYSDKTMNTAEKYVYDSKEDSKTITGSLSLMYNQSKNNSWWYTSLNFNLSHDWRDGEYIFNGVSSHLKRDYSTPSFSVYGRKSGGLWELDVDCWMSNNVPGLSSLLMPKMKNSATSWSLGNADLKNGNEIRTRLGWTKYFGKTRRVSINHSTNWNMETNREAYRMVYDKSYTRNLSYSGNVNGNWNLDNHSGINIALDSTKNWNLALGCDYNFRHSVGYRMMAVDLPDLDAISTADLRTMLSGMADQLDMTNNVQTNYVGPDFSLSYQKGTFLASLKGTYHYNHSNGNTDFILSKNYHDFQYGATVHAQLPWKLNLATDMTMYSRRGYEMAWMNDNQLIWNASIGKELMKKKFEVTLEAYDLLHQLKTRRAYVDATSYRENQFNTIPRYVLLRVQWHFNKK